MKMLGKSTFLGQPVTVLQVTKAPNFIQSCVLIQLSTFFLCSNSSYYILPLNWFYKNWKLLRSSTPTTKPKPNFLASTVQGIYNKRSIFELQTIIIHLIHWVILKSCRGGPRKMVWLVKGMGLALKMFTNYVWTLGSGVDSGSRWKAQRGHGKVKEQGARLAVCKVGFRPVSADRHARHPCP